MEDCKQPLITVVTVVYNDVKHIEDTILSVVNQTYPDIEYIIIDGGSTDGTVDIIRLYVDKIVNWISEPDQGVFDAMNKALKKATGDYIIFMNAGDSFADIDIVEKVVDYMKENDASDVYYGDVYRGNKRVDCIWKDIPFYLSKKKIRGMNICHQSIFVKLLIAKKYYFDTSYKFAADYNMMMQIFKDGGRFQYMPLTITVYDTTGIPMVNWQQTFKEEARICGYANSFLYKVELVKRKLFHSFRSLFLW